MSLLYTSIHSKTHIAVALLLCFSCNLHADINDDILISLQKAECALRCITTFPKQLSKAQENTLTFQKKFTPVVHTLWNNQEQLSIQARENSLRAFKVIDQVIFELFSCLYLHLPSRWQQLHTGISKEEEILRKIALQHGLYTPLFVKYMNKTGVKQKDLHYDLASHHIILSIIFSRIAEVGFEDERYLCNYHTVYSLNSQDYACKHYEEYTEPRAFDRFAFFTFISIDQFTMAIDYCKHLNLRNICNADHIILKGLTVFNYLKTPDDWPHSYILTSAVSVWDESLQKRGITRTESGFKLTKQLKLPAIILTTPRIHHRRSHMH